MKITDSSHSTHADPPQVNEPNAVYNMAERISYDDVPALVRYLLDEVKDLRDQVEALKKEIQNAKNERVVSAE